MYFLGVIEPSKERALADDKSQGSRFADDLLISLPLFKFKQYATSRSGEGEGKGRAPMGERARRRERRR